jgi:hypothetical protein
MCGAGEAGRRDVLAIPLIVQIFDIARHPRCKLLDELRVLISDYAERALRSDWTGET